MTSFKDAIEVAEPILTCLAILLGGGWFFWQRLRYPRAIVSHAVTHRPLREGKVLLRVTLRVENCGAILVRPESLVAWVHQVCPLHPTLVGHEIVPACKTEGIWPIIAERTCHLKDHEIEPGEPDEFHFDFELEAGVKTVLAYTYLKNVAKKKRGWFGRFGKFREIGWNITTLYDLNDEQPKQAV